MKVEVNKKKYDTEFMFNGLFEVKNAKKILNKKTEKFFSLINDEVYLSMEKVEIFFGNETSQISCKCYDRMNSVTFSAGSFEEQIGELNKISKEVLEMGKALLSKKISGRLEVNKNSRLKTFIIGIRKESLKMELINAKKFILFILFSSDAKKVKKFLSFINNENLIKIFSIMKLELELDGRAIRFTVRNGNGKVCKSGSEDFEKFLKRGFNKNLEKITGINKYVFSNYFALDGKSKKILLIWKIVMLFYALCAIFWGNFNLFLLSFSFFMFILILILKKLSCTSGKKFLIKKGFLEGGAK